MELRYGRREGVMSEKALLDDWAGGIEKILKRAIKCLCCSTNRGENVAKDLASVLFAWVFSRGLSLFDLHTCLLYTSRCV